MEGSNGAAGEHLKGSGFRKTRLDRDCLWIAKPLFEIECTDLPAFQRNGKISPPVNGSTPRMRRYSPGASGKVTTPSTRWRGGLDPSDRGYGGQQRIVKVAANLKVGAAGCQLRGEPQSSRLLLDWQSESARKTVIPRAHAENVETGEEGVPPGLSHDLPPKQACETQNHAWAPLSRRAH